jgi:conjugal transfer pilus assembly protein TraU
VRARLCVAALAAAIALGTPGPAARAASDDVKKLMCPDAKILGPTLITGICWSCMFPVYLAGVKAFDGRNSRPPGAADRRVCYCDGDLSRGELPTIGFTVGMYVPARLMEVVRKPWCFPSLFGADMGDARTLDGALMMGGAARLKGAEASGQRAMWTWHMYAFPLLEILQLVNLPQCNTDNYSSFDLMFLSEAFPHWYDGQLAFLINPEAVVFGNPIAQSAQLVDCVAASAGNARNELFWTAGCWGSHYPLVGSAGGSTSQSTSLIASRGLFLLSRLGFMKRTVGNDALCGGKKMPVLAKNQFKFQQLFPVPESSNKDPGSNPAPPAIDTARPGEPPTASEATLDPGATTVPKFNISNVGGGCCHSLGENTMLWGEWRQRPATGQDFVYLLWRWTDCCAGVLGGGG